MKAALLTLVLLIMASSASAQPFALDNASGVTNHWFDGLDLLVTGEAGVTLRHRSGLARQFAGSNAAVAGRGQGSTVEIVALRHNRVSRLRNGTWQTYVVTLGGTPDRAVMAANGETVGWSAFHRLLVRVGVDNVPTRIEMPPGHKPIQVLVSPAGEFIVVFARGGSASSVLMRLQGASLVPHPSDASARAEARCLDPDGAVQLLDGSLVLYSRQFLCHVGLGAPPAIINRGSLFGEEFRDITALVSDGARVVIADSHGGLSLWQPGENTATRLSDGGSRSVRDLFVDPGSDTIAVFEGSGPAQVVSARLGHLPREARDAAWISAIEVDEDVAGPEAGGGFMLPVGRLGFGGLASLSPTGSGAFAFDIVGGVRFLFRSGGRHPVLAAEFGYSRRGGTYETHDLLLGVVAGYVSASFGLQVAESVVFAVGAGRSGMGLRSAVRVTTLFDTFGLEVGHGLEFDTGRHELRIMFNMELAQLIVIGDLFRRLNRAVN